MSRNIQNPEEFRSNIRRKFQCILDDEDISNKFNKLNFKNNDNSYLFYTNINLEPDFENKILNIEFDSYI